MRKDTWTWQIVARDCYWRRCYRRPLTLSLPLLLELSYHSSCRHHLCDVTATTGGLQSPSPWPQRLVRCTPYKTYLFCGASNAKAAVRLFPSAFRLLALGIHPWSFSPPPLGGGRGKNGLHSSVRLMLLRTTELSRLAILERRWDGRTAWEARWSSSERQKKLIESDMFWVCYIYHAYHIACLSCVTAQMRNRGYARDCPNMRTIGPPLRCPFCQSTIEYGEENTRTGVKEIQIWREEMW